MDRLVRRSHRLPLAYGPDQTQATGQGRSQAGRTAERDLALELFFRFGGFILRDASRSLSSGAHSRDPLAMLLRMRSWTLVVRSAATPRVSNHEAPCLIMIRHLQKSAHARKTRPATASSFFNSSGSRASGPVINAVSSERSEPIGHGSCLLGKSLASRATRLLALSAFDVSTRMMSFTVTASWSGCQQSKSVTMATVA